jgi:hypothetical protein
MEQSSQYKKMTQNPVDKFIIHLDNHPEIGFVGSVGGFLSSYVAEIIPWLQAASLTVGLLLGIFALVPKLKRAWKGDLSEPQTPKE